MAAPPTIEPASPEGAPRVDMLRPETDLHQQSYDARAGKDGWVSSRPPGLAYYLGRLLSLPKTLLANWDLIYSSTRRELEARITGTLLGWVWPMIYPVFMFIVYYFVFAKLLQFKIPAEEGYEAAFGIYMFVGILAWTGFGEALGRSTGVILENGNLIKKLTFPTEVLPLNVVLVGTVNMLFGVVAFMLGCLTPMWPFPDSNLLWLLAIIPLQIMFTYGLGLFFGTLQVFLRDTMQVMTIVLTTLMFLTPIFWVPHPDIVPGIEAWMPFIEGNPLYHMVYVWRSALMSRQPPVGFTHPTLDSVLIFGAWAVGALVVGYLFFLRCQRRFADEI